MVWRRLPERNHFYGAGQTSCRITLSDELRCGSIATSSLATTSIGMAANALSSALLLVRSRAKRDLSSRLVLCPNLIPMASLWKVTTV